MMSFGSYSTKKAILIFIIFVGCLMSFQLRRRPAFGVQTKTNIVREIQTRCSSSDVITDRDLRCTCKFLLEAKNSNFFLSDQLEMDNFEKIKYTKSPAPCRNVQLLILINSAAKNKDKRRAIRSTWKPVLEKIGKVSIFFVAGETMESAVMKELHAEADLHRDVIVLQLMDEYRRISIKHVMMYKWMRDFCDSAIYLIKCDDDMIFNPFAFNFVQEEFLGNQTMNLFGQLLFETRPMRDGWQWDLPTSFYPLILYPNYLNGPALIQSRTATMKMLEVLPFIPIFGIDDAFIGGFAAALVGVKPVAHNSLNGNRPLPKNPKEQYPVFSWVAGDANGIRSDWRELMQFNLPLTSLK